MGLFDDIEVEFPMPDDIGVKNWQTKDFDCQMDHLKITADGRLLKAKWEETPEAELEYPDMPFIGSIRTTGEWDEIPYHGVIDFYTWEEEMTPQWHEYEAKFTDGKCIGITKVPANDGDHSNANRA